MEVPVAVVVQAAQQRGGQRALAAPAPELAIPDQTAIQEGQPRPTAVLAPEGLRGMSAPLIFFLAPRAATIWQPKAEPPFLQTDMKQTILTFLCSLALMAAGFAQTTISGLGTMADPLASGDILPFTDVSDTTESVNGTTKKATMTQVQTFVMTSAKLVSLTTNGFVKTSGGDGTLSVDTATYLATTGNGSSLTNIPTSIAGTSNEITASAATGAVTLSAHAALTRDTEWDTLAEVETAMGSINILAATEIDTFAEWAALTEVPETIILAVSDETTALTTGAAKVTFRMPFAMTLTAVRASVGTAPTGSTISIGINETAGSVLSTDLTIDVSEKTSTTAATAAVISDSALADDAEITIDIDQVGSTIAGAGLKVTLIGTR